MTKWDRLLAQLDKVFGFEDRARSTVKKRRQVFDEKTNEHVFILEYRVVRGEHADPKKRKEASIKRRVVALHAHCHDSLHVRCHRELASVGGG